MSYAHQARKKQIKRGTWDLQSAIDRWKGQGRDTTTVETKERLRPCNQALKPQSVMP